MFARDCCARARRRQPAMASTGKRRHPDSGADDDSTDSEVDAANDENPLIKRTPGGTGTAPTGARPTSRAAGMPSTGRLPCRKCLSWRLLLVASVCLVAVFVGLQLLSSAGPGSHDDSNGAPSPHDATSGATVDPAAAVPGLGQDSPAGLRVPGVSPGRNDSDASASSPVATQGGSAAALATPDTPAWSGSAGSLVANLSDACASSSSTSSSASMAGSSSSSRSASYSFSSADAGHAAPTSAAGHSSAGPVQQPHLPGVSFIAFGDWGVTESHHIVETMAFVRRLCHTCGVTCCSLCDTPDQTTRQGHWCHGMPCEW